MIRSFVFMSRICPCAVIVFRIYYRILRHYQRLAVRVIVKFQRLLFFLRCGLLQDCVVLTTTTKKNEASFECARTIPALVRRGIEVGRPTSDVSPRLRQCCWTRTMYPCHGAGWHMSSISRTLGWGLACSRHAVRTQLISL